MRRNLWVLDLILLVAVVVSGFMLKQRQNEIYGREQAFLRQIVPAVPPPALPSIPGVSPITAANYMETVQMMLFSRDRNPNVILDPPPPPPPPPQMPPLPVAYGVMDLGAGPTAILAEKPGAQHRGYRTGEMIGAFKILGMNNHEILFDWDGQPVKKTLQELAEKKSTIPVEAAPENPAPAAAPASTAIAAPKGPGSDLGNETRACVPGDTNAPGTVQDGMRKVVTKSPFGDVCRWETAK
jgi:hypothetical protein